MTWPERVKGRRAARLRLSAFRLMTDPDGDAGLPRLAPLLWA